MTTEERDSLPAPSILLRVTRVALVLNAAAHSVGSAGFAFGFAPHAAEQAIMGRRAGAAGFAAAFMLIFVARRLRRDTSLIALPIAFVLCQLATSAYEVLLRGNLNDLPPMVVESIFLSIYTVFVVRQRTRPV
jgi:peptidoglycan/LPS O-acetylase OafA/YrhL